MRSKQDKAYCVNLVKERDREGYRESVVHELYCTLLYFCLLALSPLLILYNSFVRKCSLLMKQLFRSHSTVCGLLTPASSRDAFFALRAFNVELASIKDAHNLRNQGNTSSTESTVNNSDVPDSTLALQLRMQWWRDAVGEICDSEDTASTSTAITGSNSSDTAFSAASRNLSISYWNSPVVRSLARAHEQCRWTRRFLERIIDARELDLETSQYETVNALASYAEHTVGSLLYLTLETCHVRDDAADQCASHAGLGVGLTTALRATPYRLATGGEVPIPAELLRPGFPYHQLAPSLLGGAADPLDSETPNAIVLSEEDLHQWRGAVQVVATTASHHLMQAREQQSAVPKRARATLLPVVPALQYLQRLERAEYNVFDHSLMTDSKSDRLRLLLLLGRTWLTGVF